MRQTTERDGRVWIVVGALFGALGVAAGAFGAHGLRDTVTPERLTVFETAVRYQLVHAVMLVVVGLLQDIHRHRLLALSAYAWTIGTGLFSGSLYVLVLTDTAWLGAITPLGGASFIVGWLTLAAWALTPRRLPRTEA